MLVLVLVLVLVLLVLVLVLLVVGVLFILVELIELLGVEEEERGLMGVSLVITIDPRQTTSVRRFASCQSNII